MLSALLTLLVLGIAGIVAIGVVMTLLGVVFSIAMGVAGVLLFKVAPLLLVGWLVLKVVERGRRPKALSDADRKWLDG